MKNFKLGKLALPILLLLTSCATTTNLSLIKPNVLSRSTPELNNLILLSEKMTISERTVGFLNTDLVIKQNFNWKGAEYYPAQTVPYKYYDKVFDYYGPLNGPIPNVYFGLSKTKTKAVLNWNNSNWQLDNIPSYEFKKSWDKSFTYLNQNLTLDSTDNFTYYFIYKQTGVNSDIESKTKIIKHDIKKSKVLNILGCKIKFSEKPNGKISYSVTSNFSEFL